MYQRKAVLAKASKRGGGISVNTQVCRLSDDIPAEILISVFIKTAEISEFVPLFDDQDITERASRAEIAEMAPLCS